MIELAVICGLLVALNAWQAVDRRHERTEVATERRDLLRRIQSPQIAAVMDYNAQSVDPGPPAIDMSDTDMGDESYWESREGWMSREELADKAAEEEIARG